MSFLGSYSPSILAIPAYFVLAMLPHGWAINVASQGQLRTWDNRNPRAADLKAALKARLPAARYAQYERLEACHANSMESFPLFAAAVVLGHVAGLEERALSGFAAWFLVARVAYMAVYATHEAQGPTVLRTGIWYVGVGLCFKTIVQAARAMGERV
ncbi:hypothetical protein C7974DRAFT_320077 [Boeremia exigua]|uniref:uncharacterized protein n=1 Tax=Boeremia exigua TaxID=749465 RepID=UPI001E8DC6FE|nr:uncharacterized protein C7974DRAFT_320077 [Boeremia exigua]KAH6614837.1 hypothetical protein C7974DRAFT_320077 [Boeremia exigua]